MKIDANCICGGILSDTNGETYTATGDGGLVYQFAVMQWENPETYNYSSSDYIRNCTGKNGTLKEV